MWHRCPGQSKNLYTDHELDCVAATKGLEELLAALRKNNGYAAHNTVCGALCRAEKEARREATNWKPFSGGRYHLCHVGPDKLPSRPFRVILQTCSPYVRTVITEGYKKGQCESFKPLNVLEMLFSAAEELWSCREIEVVVEVLPRAHPRIERPRELARAEVGLGPGHPAQYDTLDPFLLGKRPDERLCQEAAARRAAQHRKSAARKRGRKPGPKPGWKAALKATGKATASGRRTTRRSASVETVSDDTDSDEETEGSSADDVSD